ncbi:2,3-bisphosphoglycerate-independent phosphoglycerate mutase [Mesobacillus boroniphilus JCM 21738]|uniref:2,3-bisphosphoglycerate-independent phosphoglycerate mutase n=1 Tax=Mesobacillus boroniphilus JCM 21738 TaxID=1294265 RepID=W4RUN9_9BACI|nr:2,3-bisphosphoglycerate-independent phosphoglycerate mutase [Mesobacillus boroniphilus JCM 21738]
MSKQSPTALIILDGFALRGERMGNAVAQRKSRILTATGTTIRTRS